MRRFYLSLTPEVMRKLIALAIREKRHPRDQAAYLLERVLAQLEDNPVDGKGSDGCS